MTDGSSFSPDRSASNRDGGTAGTSCAITSLRRIHRKRCCGFTASAMQTPGGFFMASLLKSTSSQPVLPSYAELHCLTNFTFLRGASHPEELAARAFELKYSALAITDECSVAGVVRAHIAVKELNETIKDGKKPRLKLIVGSEVMIEEGPRLVLLATDRASYGAICALITTARMRSPKGKYRLERGDLEAGVG